jgi:hypothetical protein
VIEPAHAARARHRSEESWIALLRSSEWRGCAIERLLLALNSSAGKIPLQKQEEHRSLLIDFKVETGVETFQRSMESGHRLRRHGQDHGEFLLAYRCIAVLSTRPLWSKRQQCMHRSRKLR